MFNEVHIQNFGAFSKFDWPNLGRINVVVGENDTGKSHLLKVMYVIAKSIESRQKAAGDDLPSWGSTLVEKLRWTFQPRRGLSDLVRHGPRNAEIECDVLKQALALQVRTKFVAASVSNRKVFQQKATVWVFRTCATA